MLARRRILFADTLGASEQRFKDQFARELLVSERLRGTILLLVVGVAAAFVAREVRRCLFHSFVVLEEHNQIRDI